MNVTVISSTSPTFECTSPACYIDAESIDTSFVYDSEYASSCDTNDSITVVGGGTSGTDGTDGTDGRGITSIIRTSGTGAAGTTDTYTITYTDSTTSTFNVYNGDDGTIGDTGDAATITVGTTTTGDAETDATVTNSGTSSAAIFDFTIPAGTDGTAGSQILYGTADPTIANPGVNGDYYLRTNTYDLYYKSSSTWTVLVNIKGTTGDAGDDGTDGIDGDQWTYGATVPSDITVNTFDEYYVLTTNKNVYLKLAGETTWAIVYSLNGDTYATTSTTSVNLTTTTVGDTVVLTVDSGLAYTTGQFVVVANSTTKQFTAKVTSYSGTTLTVVVTYKTGTSTLTSWSINLAGVVEAGSVPGWYTITATAGTGTIASRTFTAPSGWTVDAATNITNTDLPTASTSHLRIKHDTGLYAIDSVIYVDEGTYNTKATGTRAYGTMYEDEDHTTIQLNSFCTETAALIIHVKLQ